MKSILVTGIVSVLLCAACSSTPAPTTTTAATTAPAASTHDADCKNLVGRLDQLERDTPPAQDGERGDEAMKRAMAATEKGAAELEGMKLADTTAQQLGTDYAKHLREKHAFMKDLLPALERFNSAVAVVRKLEAEAEPELAPCKQQKKISKACETKIKAAVDRLTDPTMQATMAQGELRKVLSDPAMKQRDEKLGVRDHDLAQRLHDQCGGPAPEAMDAPEAPPAPSPNK